MGRCYGYANSETDVGDVGDYLEGWAKEFGYGYQETDVGDVGDYLEGWAKEFGYGYQETDVGDVDDVLNEMSDDITFQDAEKAVAAVADSWECYHYQGKEDDHWCKYLSPYTYTAG